jgi:hypothetical protein
LVSKVSGRDLVETVDGSSLTKGGLETFLSKRTDRSSILLDKQLELGAA